MIKKKINLCRRNFINITLKNLIFFVLLFSFHKSEINLTKKKLNWILSVNDL